jgi:hypothetical protein
VGVDFCLPDFRGSPMVKTKPIIIKNSRILNRHLWCFIKCFAKIKSLINYFCCNDSIIRTFSRKDATRTAINLCENFHLWM